MKKIATIILAIIIALNISIIHSKSTYQNKHAITFVPRPGRFGDQIFGYSTTKWLSQKYKIPFLLYPIVPKHSEVIDQFMQLNMFNTEKHARACP